MEIPPPMTRAECQVAFAKLHDDIMKAGKAGETPLVHIQTHASTLYVLHAVFREVTDEHTFQPVLKQYNFLDVESFATAYYVRLSKKPIINGKSVKASLKKAGKDVTVSLYSTLMDNPNEYKTSKLYEHVVHFMTQLDKVLIPSEHVRLSRDLACLRWDYQEYENDEFRTELEKDLFAVTLKQKADQFHAIYGPEVTRRVLSHGWNMFSMRTEVEVLIYECGDYNTEEFTCSIQEETMRVALEKKVEEFHAKHGQPGSKLLLECGFAMNAD